MVILSKFCGLSTLGFCNHLCNPVAVLTKYLCAVLNKYENENIISIAVDNTNYF